MSKPRWRTLVTPPAAGAWNMAVDEAIAVHAGPGAVLPTLRFYSWQPACVSLGRNQRLADIDPARLAARGYDLVRRPTGGRAILHTDELTYSVAGPQDDPALAGAVLDSYLRLSQGLLAGLERLGLRVAKAPPTNRSTADAGPVCFEVPSSYEIVAGGKKLVGSAQSRRKGWVLQHGTLPLTGDIARLVDVLALDDEAARPALRADLLNRATTVESVLGRPVGFEEAADAIRAGFAEALGIDLVSGSLTEEELTLARELERDVYGAPVWNERF
ncbi:MAG: biotin/lipoate A/B protein ligase family protein [Caldilineales bacterium]